MSITRNNPNCVFLGGNRVQINDLAAKEVITPGMLVVRDLTATVFRWKKHASSGGDTGRAVATDAAMLNKGVDDTYAIGDLMEVSILEPGATAWMLIASGQTISAGDQLSSAGDGTLRSATGTVLFNALESKTNNGSGGAGSLVRIRVEAI